MDNKLTSEEKQTLLRMAREALEAGVRGQRQVGSDEPGRAPVEGEAIPSSMAGDLRVDREAIAGAIALIGGTPEAWSLMLRYNGLLLGLGLAGYVFAAVVFCRRDLPVEDKRTLNQTIL